MPWTCSLLLIVASSAPAPQPSRSTEHRQKDASLFVEGGELVKEVVRLRLSDRLSLRLHFNGRTVRVRSLRFEHDDREWELVKGPLSPPVVPDESDLQSLSIAIEPRKPGTLPLPTLSLQYRLDEKSDWHSVRWEGLTVEVVPPDVKDIRGEAPLEKLPSAATSSPFPFRELSIAVAILAAGICLLLWLRRARPTPVVPPDQKALRALDLLRQASPSANPPSWLHARVSAIIRQYLEERHDIHAPRQTTEELLLTVRQANVLGDEALRILGELLASCDRVKFAGNSPTAEDSEATLTLATTFIGQTASAQST